MNIDFFVNFSIQEQIELDRSNILFLCQWSTSSKRHGHHRALVCADVIKMRNKYALELVSYLILCEFVCLFVFNFYCMVKNYT